MEAALAAALGGLMGRRVNASLFDGKVCFGGWVARLVVERQMGVDVVWACLCSQDRRLFGEREGGGENWEPLPRVFHNTNELGSVRHECELQSVMTS